jgi:hypothetical protein
LIIFARAVACRCVGMMTALELGQDGLDLGVGRDHGVVHLLHVGFVLRAQSLAVRDQGGISLDGRIMSCLELRLFVLGQSRSVKTVMAFRRGRGRGRSVVGPDPS